MLHRTHAFAVSTGISIVLALASPGFGGTITFSTLHNDLPGPPLIPGHGLTEGQSDPAFTWNYTGNYADPRIPANILVFNANNQVTICTNGACGSSQEYGFGRTYTGYEFIYYGFQLPADATNITLNLISWVDDREIVDLNGNVLGGWGMYGSAGATAQQLDGSGTHLVTFDGPNGIPQTFSTQSWFTPGGENYLRFWINNTGNGIYGNAWPHGSYFEPSALQTYGTITFDTPAGTVPEPGGLVPGGLGLVALTLLPLRARAKR